MEFAAALIIPVILCVMGILFFTDKTLYAEFITGAEKGLRTAIGLLPVLILLLVGVNMFTASGAVDVICSLISPIFSALGVPAEALPLLVLRPISGSASIAMANDLFTKYSPDSFVGYVISVIMGSSDTLIYISAVYFSHVNVKHTRHAIPCAFLTMIFCIFISCTVCRIYFAR